MTLPVATCHQHHNGRLDMVRPRDPRTGRYELVRYFSIFLGAGAQELPGSSICRFWRIPVDPWFDLYEGP